MSRRWCGLVRSACMWPTLKLGPTAPKLSLAFFARRAELLSGTHTIELRGLDQASDNALHRILAGAPRLTRLSLVSCRSVTATWCRSAAAAAHPLAQRVGGRGALPSAARADAGRLSGCRHICGDPAAA